MENKYTPSLEALNHYVYLLIGDDKYYVGVRSCFCGIEEDVYMGSSKVMTAEEKENCDKLIIKEFDSRKEAVDYEIYLHELLDVVNDDRFWNASKQTSTGFDTTGRVMSDKEKELRGRSQKYRFSKLGHPSTGRVLTEEHKQKIGKSLVGNIHSAESRAKASASHKTRATKHWLFAPWWYEVNGSRVDVYDKTIRQFAEEHGVGFDAVKDRFRSKFAGKELTKGPLKGYKFGRIENDK